MRRLFFIAIITLFIPSSVLATTQNQVFVPANVDVLVNGQQILFTEAPIVVNNTIMLPLRDISNCFDIKIKWEPDPNRVLLMKDEGKELILSLESPKVLYGRKVSIIEQVPVLVNGHTMVSLRFIAAVMGADVTWDEKHSTVNIVDNGKFANLPLAKEPIEENDDNYYKWYDPIIGP